MGNEDKIANQGEGALGKAKEKLGDATDDRDLQAEGKKDQSIYRYDRAGLLMALKSAGGSGK